jgi:hypothetical protein
MIARANPDIERLPAALRQALGHMVTDSVGMFGQIPLARLVAMHLPLFVELRRLGADWKQIVVLLSAYGIGGTDGPITGDVMRATYARARAAAAAASEPKRNKTQRTEMQHNATQRVKAMEPPNASEQNVSQPDAADLDIGVGGAAQRDAANRVGALPSDAERTLLTRAELLNRPTR